jgi:hypothetical protein
MDADGGLTGRAWFVLRLCRKNGSSVENMFSSHVYLKIHCSRLTLSDWIEQREQNTGRTCASVPDFLATVKLRIFPFFNFPSIFFVFCPLLFRS